VAQVRAEVEALAEPELARRNRDQSFDMLLMNFAVSVGATILIRGLRSGADFEYEFQMAGMNARLNPTVENGVPDGIGALSVHRLAGWSRRSASLAARSSISSRPYRGQAARALSPGRRRKGITPSRCKGSVPGRGD